MRDPETNYEKLRRRMVDHQIAGRGIQDPRVLEALRRVPRHLFVPEAERRRAYTDQPLSLGHGQTISQPYIVALMTELCGLKGTERVLEVGTGSGYQTAVLSLLAGEVYSLEALEPLYKTATTTLEDLEFTNVKTLHGNGYFGWPAAAPFDVILLTAAPPIVPPSLLNQLSPERSVLVLPEGEGLVQNLVRITVEGGVRKRETLCSVRFVPMVGD